MNVDLARLGRCLNPKSIAVVGGTEAVRVIQQCRMLGFAGSLWPVNPKRKTMEGLDCFKHIDDLPAAPDSVFIAIPAEPSISVVETLSRNGAGGAVCYASGFREVGSDGENRHLRLIQAAGSMPVIGPNCYGFINLTCGAALWPDYHGATAVEKGVAIFSQSGNVSLNLTMQKRLLPLAWLVTLGNQAVVGIEQGIAAALDDERITAIGLHIEGLKDLPLFAQLTEQARLKGIPIVALKSGRSETGARMTLSHTATLAGESALYDALFERLGIGQVSTPEEFVETLKLVSIIGPLPGYRIASMSCSGGEATLVADLTSTGKLEFPGLARSHQRKVQLTLNEYVRVDNPLDYHTFIWGDQARMTETFSAMMAGKFDLTMMVLDIPAEDRTAMEFWLRAVQAFISACRSSGAKGVLVASLPESLPEEVGRLLIDNGVVPLQGLAQSLVAIEVACNIGTHSDGVCRNNEARAPKNELPSLKPVAGYEQVQDLTGLDEHQAKRLLNRAGLSVAESMVVDSVESAQRAADQLGYPVVMKALSKEITHKTEIGAVAVNLQNPEQVEEHAVRMLGLASRLIVEKMIDGAVAELLLGISHDRQFGHYLIIGFGGTLVELIGDREILLLPVVESMIRRALDRLKTAPLLKGYRGRPIADVDAVVKSVLALTRLVQMESGNIVEVEINPLMVKSESNGAIVADAVVTVVNEIGLYRNGLDEKESVE